MVRQVPPERFQQLVEAAAKVFLERGYRLTQMADVAEALGVAKGTLYGYVESKEALFDAAVRHADGHLAAPSPAELPLRTPPAGQTLAYVRGRIAAEAADLVLLKVVSGALVIADAAQELSLVLSDLYQRIARNRRALKLVDRCAVDYPELAAVWFGEGRGAQQLLLAELIRARAKQRRFRAIAEPDIVARTLIEAVAFWALHRHFGGSLTGVDDAVAERAVTDLLVSGLVQP